MQQHQSPEVKSAHKHKRNSGIFSFLKWFQPVFPSRESIHAPSNNNSLSGSIESVCSITSIETVASFSYLPPSSYTTPVILEKYISAGPETDTYKARLKKHENRRESDKNITLREKYNLYFNSSYIDKYDTIHTTAKEEPTGQDNCKSLPLMTRRKCSENTNNQKYKVRLRKTNSDGSKNRMSDARLHVKGKRKAPQPPIPTGVNDNRRNTFNIVRRNYRTEKRLAPAPPFVSLTFAPDLNLLTNENNNKYNVKYNLTNLTDSVANDSVQLDPGTLKSTKDKNQPTSSWASFIQNNSPECINNLCIKSTTELLGSKNILSSVSIKPRYKRNSTSENKVINYQENRYEYSAKPASKKKSEEDDKKLVGLLYLANISELDKETVEILKKKVIMQETQATINELPEFISRRDSFLCQTDLNVLEKNEQKIERKIVRDLIFKFDASANITKELTQIIPKKQNRINNFNRKTTWYCQKCKLENDYWRIICYKCSSKKLYIDNRIISDDSVSKSTTDVSANVCNTNSNKLVDKEICLNNTSYPSLNTDVPISVNLVERNKTEMDFAIQRKFRVNLTTMTTRANVARLSTDNKVKKDENETLKMMLIEMKNSLPKRKSMSVNLNRKISIQETSKSSIIERERTIEPIFLNKEQQVMSNATKVAEMVLLTSQTIYENVKVKIPLTNTNVIHLKVSTPAQTNAVVRNPIPISLQQLIPNAVVDDLVSISHHDKYIKYSDDANSDNYISYTQLTCNNAASNDNAKPGKDIFIHLSKQEPLSLDTETFNSKMLDINILLNKLEISIAQGDRMQASAHARNLAVLKVNCSVVRQKEIPNTGDQYFKEGNEFVIDLFIEDRLSHRGPFTIQVRADLTVLQLKQLVAKEFKIPVNAQKWILGKELAVNDNNTLQEYKISNGCVVFLYLIASDAHIVKNTKVEYNHITVTETTVIDSEPSREVGLKTSALQYRNLESNEKHEQIMHATKFHNSFNIPEECIIKKEGIVDDSSINHTNVNTSTELTRNEDICLNGKQYYIDTNIELIKSTIERQSYGTSDKKLIAILHENPIFQSLKKMSNNLPTQLVEKSTIKENEWVCLLCTLMNPMNTNICRVCANLRPSDTSPIQLTEHVDLNQRDVWSSRLHYQELVHLDNTDLVSNWASFECLICIQQIKKGAGVILRECLHQFCRTCLANAVEYCEDAEIKCPFRDEKYSCNMVLQTREIRALVTKPVYDQFLAKSVRQAENNSQKSYHCKTPDCEGWCLYEDNVNQFRCPVCRKNNCMTCQAIHDGVDCRQYQNHLFNASEESEESHRTRIMLNDMVRLGNAVHCPTCRVVVIKKMGCDWVRCTVCKTEICWVTKGARWGPGGKGDISAGCKCGVNGIKCHPQCNYCH